MKRFTNADGQLIYDLGPVNTDSATGPGMNMRQVKAFEYYSDGGVKTTHHGTVSGTIAPGEIQEENINFLLRIEYEYHPAWGSIAEKTLYNYTGLERREVYTYGDEWGDLLKVETFGGSGVRTRLVSYQYDTLGRLSLEGERWPKARGEECW